MSACYVQFCVYALLLRREVHNTGANAPKNLPDRRAERRRFIMRAVQGNENGEKSPTFMRNADNCLIGREIYNRAGLIELP